MESARMNSANPLARPAWRARLARRAPLVRLPRLARLAAASALALACLLALCACSSAADRHVTLKLFDKGTVLSDTEHVVSTGSIPANSGTGSSLDDALTDYSLTFYLPATVVADATPDSVTYTSLCESVTLNPVDPISDESRISLSDTFDNPVMGLLYQLQQMAEGTPGESVTVAGEKATDMLALSMTVTADEDSLRAINATYSTNAAATGSSLPGKAELVSQLSNGCLSVTARYPDGTDVSRSYALAVHETAADGTPTSYLIIDITDQ